MLAVLVLLVRVLKIMVAKGGWVVGRILGGAVLGWLGLWLRWER